MLLRRVPGFPAVLKAKCQQIRFKSWNPFCQAFFSYGDYDRRTLASRWAAW